jgi:DUF1680 family protein
MLASLPGYLYSVSDEGLWVHLYAGGTARLPLADGRTIGLTQRTRYPWDGEVVVEVEGEGPFALMLRIPAWCESGAALEVNGQPFDSPLVPGSYAQVRRAWRPGDAVRLDLPTPVRPVECHPHVPENAGRVALMRGPLLYCVEGADHPGLDLRDVVLPAGTALSAAFRSDLLGGVVVLRSQAQVVSPGAAWDGRLYRTVPPRGEEPASQPVELMGVPYYAWANREPGPMQVWLRTW